MVSLVKFVKQEHVKVRLASILTRKTFDSDHLIPFDLKTLPVRLEAFDYDFFTLEIGSGWGEFTLEYARENPDHLIIALEKKKKRVMKSITEQDKRQIKNIKWMVLDVNWFFEEIFPENSFDRVITNFPDPWPKNKHKKHRFLNKKNLDIISKICKKGGMFELVTDCWKYLEEVLYLLEDSLLWKNSRGQGVVLERIKENPRSFFEKMLKEEGKKIYDLLFMK